MRLDQALVAQGHVATRARAQDLIKRGLVQVDGQVCRKASQSITSQKVIADDHPWVSRAGLKLVGALEALPDLNVTGRICLDLGTSTGGFSQVLLFKGAAHVTAVDVGTDQLHPSLIGQSNLTNRPQTDVRDLSAAEFDPLPDLLVSDLSFISLTKALPAALALAPRGADLIALFKPQFEVGRAHIGAGGLVTDQDAINLALANFKIWLTNQGWPPQAEGLAAVAGGDGNQETWVAAKKA